MKASLLLVIGGLLFAASALWCWFVGQIQNAENGEEENGEEENGEEENTDGN